jgi:hypothetical protein
MRTGQVEKRPLAPFGVPRRADPLPDGKEPGADEQMKNTNTRKLHFQFTSGNESLATKVISK